MENIEPNNFAKVTFFPLTDEEIERQSVCLVAETRSLDKENRPVPGGLYDPRMGTNALFDGCQTCRQPKANCPGHLGHVLLPLPVYNYLLYKDLQLFLKSMCFVCFRLSVTSEDLAKNPNRAAAVALLQKKVPCCEHCKAASSRVKKLDSLCFRVKTPGVPVLLLTPLDVERVLADLFCNERAFFAVYYFSDFTPTLFCRRALQVPPNFARTPNKVGDNVFDDVSNTQLKLVLGLAAKLTASQIAISTTGPKTGTTTKTVSGFSSSLLHDWCVLQDVCNLIMDSSVGHTQSTDVSDKTAGKVSTQGLRQRLDKKEGLFRNNLMGKRVNHCARSVISPDAAIDTAEVGLPLEFAKRLSFPEQLNSHNQAFLKQCVLNGVDRHPGASVVVCGRKRPVVRQLARLSVQQRAELVASLYRHSRVVVHRHLVDGDVVLLNRQPTLHKQSMMAHSVRVLARQSVLRLHVANCKSYNADFDGDEMNVFVPRNLFSVAELRTLAAAPLQFFSSSTGHPLRGLVQDYVVASVLLTKKNTFLRCGDFFLLRDAVLFASRANPRIAVLPTVLKPAPRWSGKQLFSATLAAAVALACSVSSLDYAGTSAVGQKLGERSVLVRGSVLLFGVAGKEQIGGKRDNLVSRLFNQFGAKTAEFFLSHYARLLVGFLKTHGFSCGIKDLRLTATSRLARNERLAVVEAAVFPELAQALECGTAETSADLCTAARTKAFPPAFVLPAVEVCVKGAIDKLAARVVTVCELQHPLTNNGFGLMIHSGSKGSPINLSQITALVGQQQLGGKRAQRNEQGATLPCFAPFDFLPAAGAFVEDSYFVGLNCAAFFFHCAAGREGLVDTTIKTSSSGYLQRSLVKGLEGVFVAYDGSVRDEGNCLLQLAAGEDGVHPEKESLLFSEDFLYGAEPKQPTNRKNAKRKKVAPGEGFSVVPEKFLERVRSTFRKRGTEVCSQLLEKSKQQFARCRFEPGESVGVLAAQAVGEPASQMTLNTFHLAGHGATNVTLGIPRLRELLMHGSAQAAGVQTIFSFGEQQSHTETFVRFANKQTLASLVHSVTVEEAYSVDTPRRRLLRCSVFFSLAKNRSLESNFAVLGQRASVFYKTDLTKLIKNKFFKAFAHKLVKQKTSDRFYGVGTDFSENIEEETQSTSLEVCGTQKLASIRVNAPELTDSGDGKWQLHFEASFPSSRRNRIDIPAEIFSAAESVLLNRHKDLLAADLRENFDTSTNSTVYCVCIPGNVLRKLFKAFPLADLGSTSCNDVVAIEALLGVEAARATLVEEVRTVFAFYGIEVNYRYLSLLGDFMTKTGHYMGINRRSIKNSDSVFQKTTFETATRFLEQAALTKSSENFAAPATNIIFGQPVQNGTNFFDVYYNHTNNFIH